MIYLDMPLSCPSHGTYMVGAKRGLRCFAQACFVFWNYLSPVLLASVNLFVEEAPEDGMRACRCK